MSKDKGSAGKDNSAFGFGELFERLGLKMDVGALMDAQRRQFENAFAAFAKVADGYQKVISRQQEMMAETMGDLSKAMTSLTERDSGGATSGQRIETAKTAVEKAVNHMTELADLTQKANQGAFDLMRAQITEGFSILTGGAKSDAGKGKS